MKVIIIATACVLVAFFSFVVDGQCDDCQGEQLTASDSELSDLLVERREVLREIMELFVIRYKEGSTTLENVIQAKNRLLDAELKIAKSKPERIRIRKEQVKNLRDLENEMTLGHKDGRNTSVEILEVKATRLEAEIKLLHE